MTDGTPKQATVAMTEGTPKRASKRRRRREPDRVVVSLLSIAAFLLLLAFLAFQMPGSGAASDASGKRRPVVLRRIYETKLVERVPATVPEGTSTSQSSSGTTQAAPAAPATRTS